MVELNDCCFLFLMKANKDNYISNVSCHNFNKVKSKVSFCFWFFSTSAEGAESSPRAPSTLEPLPEGEPEVPKHQSQKLKQKSKDWVFCMCQDSINTMTPDCKPVYQFFFSNFLYKDFCSNQIYLISLSNRRDTRKFSIIRTRSASNQKMTFTMNPLSCDVIFWSTVINLTSQNNALASPLSCRTRIRYEENENVDLRLLQIISHTVSSQRFSKSLRLYGQHNYIPQSDWTHSELEIPTQGGHTDKIDAFSTCDRWFCSK